MSTAAARLKVIQGHVENGKPHFVVRLQKIFLLCPTWDPELGGGHFNGLI